MEKRFTGRTDDGTRGGRRTAECFRRYVSSPQLFPNILYGSTACCDPNSKLNNLPKQTQQVEEEKTSPTKNTTGIVAQKLLQAEKINKKSKQK